MQNEIVKQYNTVNEPLFIVKEAFYLNRLT